MGTFCEKYWSQDKMTSLVNRVCSIGKTSSLKLIIAYFMDPFPVVSLI
jgi:hypothetical protein